jgi:fused signal recognition particle receptor
METDMFRNLFKKKSDKLADEIIQQAQEQGKVDDSLAVEKVVEEPKTWFDRLKDGLSRTRGGWVSAVGSIFGTGEITEEKLDDFEELLIQGDLGVTVAMELTDRLRDELEEGNLKTAEDVERILKNMIVKELTDDVSAIKINEKPFSVIVMVGINGVGKTTTIAKLTKLFQKLGKKCMLVAADTFRAGAVEQLEVWSERLGNVTVVKGHDNQDPASVAFDGIQKAKQSDVDIVLVDTAGRLHTQVNLMDEIKKIVRVIEKNCPEAPHEIFMVIDSTTGQNAVQQARSFHEAVNLSGLVVTKLDGTAKGGIVIGIHRELGVPIRFIGVGEQFEDLEHFNASEFTEALFVHSE